MDISASLTAEEVATLSDPDRPCEEAMRMLHVVGNAGLQNGGNGELVTFEASLRIKNTLDVLEERARVESSWKLLSILVNCEYQLYNLNQSTPLRHNPFLSHWVEAVQRLGNATTPSSQSVADSAKLDGPLDDKSVHTVRVELIKSLLQSRNPSQFAQLTPRGLYKNFVELRQRTLFDVGQYISMLEEEGIYESAGSAKAEPGVSSKRQNPLPKKNTAGKPMMSSKEQWKQDLLSRLETDPDSAMSELTHLPIELAYLDLLTTLLQDKTLERLSMDPPSMIRNYIQHALRLAEQMGQDPGSIAARSSGSSSLGGATEVSGGGEIDHGRDAQVRAVKLLLLFIRNLIRKALLPPETIYFEIQEICVRYVWIKEVREFRAFIEEGTSAVQAA